MNEMRERVANNMTVAADEWMANNGGPNSWIDIPMEVLADAAIAAMCGPTSEMIEAGADQLIGLVREGREAAVVTIIWRVMIDAALAEKETVTK